MPLETLPFMIGLREDMGGYWAQAWSGLKCTSEIYQLSDGFYRTTSHGQWLSCVAPVQLSHDSRLPESRSHSMRHFSAIQKMLTKSFTEELWSFFSMNLGFPLEITESFQVQLIAAGQIWGCSTSHMEVIQLWLCVTDVGSSSPALSQLFVARNKKLNSAVAKNHSSFPISLRMHPTMRSSDKK